MEVVLGLEVVRPPRGSSSRRRTWRRSPVSVSPDLTLYVFIRALPSGTVVLTATGLSSVPSSRNGPSTSVGPATRDASATRRGVDGRRSSACDAVAGSGSGSPNSTLARLGLRVVRSPRRFRRRPRSAGPARRRSVPPVARRGGRAETLTTDAPSRMAATAMATARSWPDPGDQRRSRGTGSVIRRDSRLAQLAGHGLGRAARRRRPRESGVAGAGRRRG